MTVSWTSLSSIVERMRTLLTLPNFQIGITDIIEILIIAILFYKIIIWCKNTRAWNLFKGIMVVLVFVFMAFVFQMNTILFIAKNTLSIALTAILIIFQPELRQALENLGGKNMFAGFLNLNFGSRTEVSRFSDKTIEELTRACFAMGKVKTGALIVIEDNVRLDEYIRTGIDVDGIVTNQLLINIFEKNTPLHDGAVIVRGDRIVSATCYLPLSDNNTLDKNLGTRHRAAVGISEVSDSLTLIVSEETGKVSLAYQGRIEAGVNAERLQEQLRILQNKHFEDSGFDKLKRRFMNETKDNEVRDHESGV